jgi:uncharacterized membrane protein
MFKIGIINAETGKVVIEREATAENALEVARKVSQWFDHRDTFFSGKPIWEHWKVFPGLERFQRLIEGSSRSNVVCESIIVFKEGKGTEYEFYMERRHGG